MKKLSLILTFSTLSLMCAAQSPWGTNLNEITGTEEPNLGTSNSKPLNFFTNNQKRLTLTPDGNMILSSLADPGTADRLVYMDENGQFKQVGYSAFCATQIPWTLGGNNAGSTTNIIGTCNTNHFRMMANSIKSLTINGSTGFIGIGDGNVNSTTNALVDISNPANSNTDHMLIYGDAGGGIESSTDMQLFYNGNFNIIQGNYGTNFTPAFTIDGGGRVGVGNTTAAGARMSINGLGMDGLHISSSGSGYALGIYNSAGAPRFKVFADGKSHMTDNAQIGFQTTVGMVDNNARLNLDANGTINGLKVSTNNYGSSKSIEVANSSYTNSTFVVYSDGKTHIGVGRPKTGGTAAAAMLSVDGMILAKDIRVATSTATHWADFVFDNNYKLMPLKDVATYVAQNKHLPDVPSEAEVKADGISLMDMNVKLLQKVEELYLHTIELQKQVDALKQANVKTAETNK